MITVSFLFDKILSLITVFLLANDGFDFIFWLVIDDHGWWQFLSAVWEEVAVIFAVQFEEGCVEYGVCNDLCIKQIGGFESDKRSRVTLAPLQHDKTRLAAFHLQGGAHSLIE